MDITVENDEGGVAGPCASFEAHCLVRRVVVWWSPCTCVHDNETFLLCPEAYKKQGLEQTRLPPNSGDLNPIETVWARLRKDIAKREQVDLREGRTLTVARFWQRVAQLLQSYSVVQPGRRRTITKSLHVARLGDWHVAAKK